MHSSFVSIGVQNRSNAEASDTLKEFSSCGFKTERELTFHITVFELNSVFKQLEIRDWYDEEEQTSEDYTGQIGLFEVEKP